MCEFCLEVADADGATETAGPGLFLQGFLDLRTRDNRLLLCADHAGQEQERDDYRQYWFHVFLDSLTVSASGSLAGYQELSITGQKGHDWRGLRRNADSLPVP